METKAELAKAIIAVMKAVKGIDKSMTIGTGSNSYKGVPDQEVKKIIGEAMERNGLCILPIGVEAKTQVDRWEETGGQYGNKMKQSVFTEATTKYLLLHVSGESQVLEGYGQGVDSQDKSAGKATTYALKYTLLYTFLVPTGKIDDADNTHSNDIQSPQNIKEVLVKSLPAQAKKAIEEATTKEGLTAIWNANVSLQSLPLFTELIKKRRGELL
jgi:hypothetical protein